jgi:hypothetical protein
MSTTNEPTTGKKISNWMADRGTDVGDFLTDLGDTGKVQDMFKQMGDFIHMIFTAMFDPENYELESAVRGWGKRDWERDHPEATYSHDSHAPSGPAQTQAPRTSSIDDPAIKVDIDLKQSFDIAATGLALQQQPGWGVRAPENNPVREQLEWKANELAPGSLLTPNSP